MEEINEDFNDTGVTLVRISPEYYYDYPKEFLDRLMVQTTP